MTARNNVVAMPEQQSLERHLLAQAQLLGELFSRCCAEALGRIKEAEAKGIERLNEYTPQDRLLTLKEAAAYLGFTPRTLRSWCNGTHPILQFSLIGGELRFRKAWLDEAVEKRSVRPNTINL